MRCISLFWLFLTLFVQNCGVLGSGMCSIVRMTTLEACSAAGTPLARVVLAQWLTLYLLHAPVSHAVLAVSHAVCAGLRCVGLRNVFHCSHDDAGSLQRCWYAASTR